MKNESLDTSLETARDVVRETAKEASNSATIRNVAMDVLNLGFENQFDEDRDAFRKQIDLLISSAANEIASN